MSKSNPQFSGGKVLINNPGDLKQYTLARLEMDNQTRAHYAEVVGTSTSTLTRFLNSKKEGEAAIIFETALKLILSLDGRVEMPALDHGQKEIGELERTVAMHDLELRFLREMTNNQTRVLKFLTGTADSEPNEEYLPSASSLLSRAKNANVGTVDGLEEAIRIQELELKYLREAADNQTRLIKLLTGETGPATMPVKEAPIAPVKRGRKKKSGL